MILWDKKDFSLKVLRKIYSSVAVEIQSFDIYDAFARLAALSDGQRRSFLEHPVGLAHGISYTEHSPV